MAAFNAAPAFYSKFLESYIDKINSIFGNQIDTTIEKNVSNVLGRLKSRKSRLDKHNLEDSAKYGVVISDYEKELRKELKDQRDIFIGLMETKKTLVNYSFIISTLFCMYMILTPIFFHYLVPSICKNSFTISMFSLVIFTLIIQVVGIKFSKSIFKFFTVVVVYFLMPIISVGVFCYFVKYSSNICELKNNQSILFEFITILLCLMLSTYTFLSNVFTTIFESLRTIFQIRIANSKKAYEFHIEIDVPYEGNGTLDDMCFYLYKTFVNKRKI